VTLMSCRCGIAVLTAAMRLKTGGSARLPVEASDRVGGETTQGSQRRVRIDRGARGSVPRARTDLRLMSEFGVPGIQADIGGESDDDSSTQAATGLRGRHPWGR